MQDVKQPVVLGAPLGELDIADHRGQEVVEVVGDPAGKLPDYLQLLGLSQIFFDLPALGDVPERAGQPNRMALLVLIQPAFGNHPADAVVVPYDPAFEVEFAGGEGVPACRLEQLPILGHDIFFADCSDPARQQRGIGGESLARRRARLLVCAQVEIPGAHLGRFERHSEPVLSGNQLVVGLLKLPGSFPYEFFETACCLLALDQVSGRLVLPASGKQRRVGGGDERHRLHGPLLQRHVAELFHEIEGVLVQARITAASRQDDEREVRPRRLTLHPVEKRAQVGRKKGLLSEDGGAGAGFQLAP